MRCSEARSRFSLAYDSELGSGAEAFHAHLRGCADCRGGFERYAGELDTFGATLGRLCSVVDGWPLSPVEDALAAAADKPSWWRTWAWEAAMVAAGTACVLVGLWLWAPPGSPPQPSPSPARPSLATLVNEPLQAPDPEPVLAMPVRLPAELELMSSQVEVSQTCPHEVAYPYQGRYGRVLFQAVNQADDELLRPCPGRLVQLHDCQACLELGCRGESFELSWASAGRVYRLSGSVAAEDGIQIARHLDKHLEGRADSHGTR